MEQDAYSIQQFCSRHSLSRSSFYNLKAAGKGPKLMTANGRVLISKESAEAWRRQCEASGPAEAA
jgi:hypothetical protein